MACANNASYAINSDGELYSCGLNSFGLLGDGTTTDNAVLTQVGTDTDWLRVFDGHNHVIALKAS